MTIKELLLTGWWSERHRSHVRPLWQIIALAPVWLLYLPARWFVDRIDRI